MKNNRKSKSHYFMYLAIGLLALIIPLLIGLLVSTPAFFNIVITNDWIGFWGGYSGSIIGGIITLIVMKSTLSSSFLLQEREKRHILCNHVAHLVSNFCIEMLAYRSKWNYLFKVAEGGPIDQERKIDIGATSEKSRQAYFELEILLADIPSASEVLAFMDKVLDDSDFIKLSVKEADKILAELRQKAKAFITAYVSIE